MEQTSAIITIRKAAAADVAEVVRLRRMMFEHMGETDRAKLEALDEACASYFSEVLATGELHVWLAVNEGGRAIACAGIIIDQHPPGPDNLSGKIAYIHSMVTEPAYRRRGLARRILQAILRWANEHGITKVALHASEDGKALYQSVGFKSTSEMHLDLA